MNPNIQPIPEYKAPEPSRMQNFALKLAGVAVGTPWGENPTAIMHDVATQVGGFEIKPPMTSYGAEDQVEYRHRGVRTVDTPLRQDETTRSASEQRYLTGTDFAHASGTTALEYAVTASVNGMRSAENLTLRGRVARRLTAYAFKGVGASAFTTKR